MLFAQKALNIFLTETNMKTLKQQFLWLALLLVSFQSFGSLTVKAFVGEVVINEVAWAGSSDNSNDEWIELYNTGNQAVDLSGWSIVDDGTSEYKITAGTIAPHGYFLIEDSEESVGNKQADAIIGLSLANAGDSLVLKDNSGTVIDEVNKSGGAWPAGNNTTKASMERIKPDKSGNEPTNWENAKSGNGSKGRNGLDLLGTPGSVNSNYGGEGVEVFMDPKEFFVAPGAFVEVKVSVANASDLYAYGLEINYPEQLLSFVSAQEGELLKIDAKPTTFYSGLKDNQEGTLLVGAARLVNPAKGVDGGGILAKLKFKVIAKESDSGEITAGASSFLANSQGDVVAKFSGVDVNVADLESINLSIANLKVEEGDKRYSLKLSWQEDLDGANYYIIKKKLANGKFETLAQISDSSFVDSDEEEKGGKIVPGINYLYQVIAVKDNVYSEPFEVTGNDSRGVIGDNDRNDIVNGKDVERLARSYGSEFNDEEYDPLKDTNFDGVIDGGDLIDIGVNFGLTYKP